MAPGPAPFLCPHYTGDSQRDPWRQVHTLLIQEETEHSRGLHKPPSWEVRSWHSLKLTQLPVKFSPPGIASGPQMQGSSIPKRCLLGVHTHLSSLSGTVGCLLLLPFPHQAGIDRMCHLDCFCLSRSPGLWDKRLAFPCCQLAGQIPLRQRVTMIECHCSPSCGQLLPSLLC